MKKILRILAIVLFFLMPISGFIMILTAIFNNLGIIYQISYNTFLGCVSIYFILGILIEFKIIKPL